MIVKKHLRGLVSRFCSSVVEDAESLVKRVPSQCSESSEVQAARWERALCGRSRSAFAGASRALFCGLDRPAPDLAAVACEVVGHFGNGPATAGIRRSE